jgi:hypothetical protein
LEEQKAHSLLLLNQQIMLARRLHQQLHLQHPQQYLEQYNGITS